MHAVYLGVVKHFTLLWYDPSQKGKMFRLNAEKEKIIDRLLLQIKPPKRVSRTPRSIITYGKIFKAQEWSMWLLYYSPIVLLNVLDKQVYEHWLLLVNGVAALVANTVNMESSNKANECLAQFVSSIPKIYGESHCSYNSHLLTHLSRFSQLLGPLQYFTMTPFENFNMYMVNCVKSSNCVLSQVAKKFARKFVEESCELKVETEDYKKTRLSVWGDYRAHTINIPLTDMYTNLLNQKNLEPWEFASKLNLKNASLYSSFYNKSQKRISYVYETAENVSFEAHFFAFAQSVAQIFVVGKKLHTYVNPLFPPHIKTVSVKEYSIINVNLLKNVCLKLECETETYILQFLNSIDNYNE